MVGHSIWKRWKHRTAFNINVFWPQLHVFQPLYQLSPIEDLELAKTLIRPGSLFQEDLAKEKKFSDKAYGSVPIVYAVCDEDKANPAEFQRWMIKNGGVTDVVEIHGADHMPMFSKPQEVCDCLIKIAHKYA